MRQAILACIVIPLLLWGLLLPKVSAVLLSLNPNIETAVICTGTEMITVRIAADGTPIETLHVSDAPCVMADPSTTADTEIPNWVKLARSYRIAFVTNENRQTRHDPANLVPDGQAPPRLV